MESKDQLKQIDIKNCTCYYFDNIIIDFDINFDNILLDKKLYENILVHDILYKTSMGPKPLGIRFNKIDIFIRVCGGEFRYFLLFDHGLLNKICGKVKYLISKKSGITDSINHTFGKIRIDSCYSLPTEKILTFHNVIILVKSVVNKNKNEYFYNIILEKVSYKDKYDTRYF